MKFTAAFVLLASVAVASGYRDLLQVTSNTQVNYNPVSITVNSAPYTILATPITPVLPYSQAAYQCNVTGDSRYPPYATGTFPLTVTVPSGSRVRVVFANGNLNGATVTQQGTPGVIVQQNGAVIVQQAGGASPIVQKPSSPVVQSNAPASALVVQQGPTVIQQNPPPASPVVQPVSPSTPSNPSTPAPTTPGTPAPTTKPATPAPTTPAPTTAAPTTKPATTTPTPAPTTAAPTTKPATTTPTPAPTTTTPTPAATTAAPTSTATTSTTTTPAPTTTKDATSSGKRRSLQQLLAGGPNNGLVEYVGLISANTVPGFVVPNTAFGVPYVEYTASSSNVGQTASFKGSLVVANVVNNVVSYPFTVNPSLSPFCQVNVNFKTA